MKKITVTGKGRLIVSPNITEVTLIINGLEDEYHQALARSVDETNVLKLVLVQHGLDKETLKTKNFEVYKKVKQVKDSYGNYHDKFIGYKYNHSLSFRFDNNNELLGKILYTISKLNINPEINVRYLIKDIEKAKNDLLANAIKDSMLKANIMAEASNVELGDIQSIDYSWGTIRYEPHDYNLMGSDSILMCNAAADTFDIDIEPDDVELTDTVTVVWNIK